MDVPVGWSNPPRDIMECIFERLEDPFDLLHCYAVCSSWYSIARHSPRQHLRNLPPYILLSHTITRNCESNSSSGNATATTEKEVVLYNHLYRNDRRFSLPAKFCTSLISGSSHGWLISIQREQPCEIWLINTVSHAQIRLPNGFGTESWSDDRLRIVMSANPDSDPNCMILAIVPGIEHLAFCQVGDSSWTWTKIDTSHLEGDYSCATFYKGKFHVYYYTEKMLQINLSTSRVPEIVILQTRGLPEADEILTEVGGRIIKRRHYMMESSGDLLLVSKDFSDFRVHKFDYEKSEWIRVEDLGNRALFVGYNNSMSVVVEADEEQGGGRCGGCRANCIYCIDDCSDVQLNFLGSSRGLYDMSVRKYKRWIPGIGPVWFSAPLSWILPQV